MAPGGKQWVLSPHTGGTKLTPILQADVRSRIQRYAEKNHAGAFTSIDVRFRGALCYIDAFTEPVPPSKDLLRATGETRDEYLERLRGTPLHLCRLRYFRGRDQWSIALYTYSGERYEPGFLPSGDSSGTLEECFDLAASFYL